MFEGNVARREDLSWQQLPTNVLLTELLQIRIGQENSGRQILFSNEMSDHLDVVSEWQDRKVARKDDVVAVDPRSVFLIETAQAIHLDRRAELNAGNLERARRPKHCRGTKGQQY